MGIDLYLQDESGQIIESLLDPASLLSRLVLEAGTGNSHFVGYIDPYGDTIFNRLQMPQLIEELNIAANRTAPVVAQHIREVLRLAVKCRDAVHLYLKFCGD